MLKYVTFVKINTYNKIQLVFYNFLYALIYITMIVILNIIFLWKNV